MKNITAAVLVVEREEQQRLTGQNEKFTELVRQPSRSLPDWFWAARNQPGSGVAEVVSPFARKS